MQVTPSTGDQYRPPQLQVSPSAGVVHMTTSEGGPSADDVEQGTRGVGNPECR